MSADSSKVDITKKQLELAQNFSRFKIEGKIPKNWKLVLAGKIQPGDEDYVSKIEDTYAQYGVVLKTDVQHEELVNLYRHAAIYWHATGLGEDEKSSPEKFEHFGITTCEAIANECIAIVYNAGGQPEIVENGVSGYVFESEEELQTITTNVIRMIEARDETISKMRMAAHRRSATFGRDAFLSNMEKVNPTIHHFPNLLALRTSQLETI